MQPLTPSPDDDRSPAGASERGGFVMSVEPAARSYLVSHDLYGGNIAELFHENTKIVSPRDEESDSSATSGKKVTDDDLLRLQVAGYKHYSMVDRVTLPSAPFSGKKVTLEAVLRSRRSRRQFADVEVALADFSSFIDLVAGVTEETTTQLASGPIVRRFHSFPSGGNLHTLEVYVVARHIESLTPGVYHYTPLSHTLEQLCALDMKTLYPTLADVFPGSSGQMACTAAFTVLVSSVLRRTFLKYGPRGYRYSLLEAGHLAQNALLLAEALEWNACMNAGYYDDRVHDLLQVDGVNEVVVYTGFFGPGA